MSHYSYSSQLAGNRYKTHHKNKNAEQIKFISNAQAHKL